MPNQTAIAMASLLMGGVLDRHPRVRVCFAHGGGSFACLLGRIDHGFRVRPDLCQTGTQRPPSAYLLESNVYVDYLVHDRDVLRLVIEKFGRERVMVGSDYPFPLGELSHLNGPIVDLNDGKLGILLRSANAKRFLKLS